jgi:hypothetical protein
MADKDKLAKYRTEIQQVSSFHNSVTSSSYFFTILPSLHFVEDKSASASRISVPCAARSLSLFPLRATTCICTSSGCEQSLFIFRISFAFDRSPTYLLVLGHMCRHCTFSLCPSWPFCLCFICLFYGPYSTSPLIWSFVNTTILFPERLAQSFPNNRPCTCPTTFTHMPPRASPTPSSPPSSCHLQCRRRLLLLVHLLQRISSHLHLTNMEPR